jgi:hypothetical protein
MIETNHLEVSREAGRAFARRGTVGEFVTLNLLRFRDMADYSASPEFAAPTSLSGAGAYDRYIAHALPLLRESGGDLLFVGAGGPFPIGPEQERWDRALLIRQKSTGAFLHFAVAEVYLAGIGHHTAGLSGSRLLPPVELQR